MFNATLDPFVVLLFRRLIFIKKIINMSNMKSLLSLPSQISFLILCFFILTVNSYAQR